MIWLIFLVGFLNYYSGKQARRLSIGYKNGVQLYYFGEQKISPWSFFILHESKGLVHPRQHCKISDSLVYSESLENGSNMCVAFSSSRGQFTASMDPANLYVCLSGTNGQNILYCEWNREYYFLVPTEIWTGSPLCAPFWWKQRWRDPGSVHGFCLGIHWLFNHHWNSGQRWSWLLLRNVAQQCQLVAHWHILMRKWEKIPPLFRETYESLESCIWGLTETFYNKGRNQWIFMCSQVQLMVAHSPAQEPPWNHFQPNNEAQLVLCNT